MIRYILYFCLICHLFGTKHAEPILGEKVWPADPQDFSFIASIGSRNSALSRERIHFCAGSLITRSHVLTAAHCLRGMSTRFVDVVVGEINLSVKSPGYKVHKWITYNEWAVMQGWGIQCMLHDIAIVVLQTPVNRPNVKPVILTNLNNERLYGTSAVMAGWGATSARIGSHVLLRAKLSILTPQECSKKVKLTSNRGFYAGNKHLCGWSTPYVLTGAGDSGGPLLDQNNVLLGVISSKGPNETNQWGNFPLEFLNQYKINLFTSVYYYRDFIQSQTGLTRGIHY